VANRTGDAVDPSCLWKHLDYDSLSPMNDQSQFAGKAVRTFDPFGPDLTPASRAQPASRLSALRFELAAFLLIVLTFAAVLLRGAVVDRHFGVGPATVARYSRYWYSDGDTQGTSSIGSDPAGPLSWHCNLTPVFANRYCGFGILFDVAHKGAGRDFSNYERVTLDLDYRGPSRYLKLVFKNSDPRYASVTAGDSAKPNTIEFPAMQGHNHVVLNLRDMAVEQWWINAHPRLPQAGKVELQNVVAVDLQTGTGAAVGRHDFTLRGLTVSGAAIPSDIWYLVLLGCWTGLTALYLVYRVSRMRREHAAHQRVLLEEQYLLQQARDAAESASRAKSRFLAHMSHELRTPLNAILGYAQILRACELSDRQNVAARTIQQSGEHLLALIGDILDISRIEAGKLELAPRPVELRAIVRGVADMIAVRAQEKGLAFHWQIASDVPHWVVADDKCLRQILLNLLGNAVKFTAEGEVVLTVTQASDADGRQKTRFEVRDTGPGIAGDQLDRIFEPFEQLREHAGHAGGTGLGLSISRHIVALMQGTLTVETMPRRGSLFAFEIPVSVVDDQAPPPAGPANDAGDIWRNAEEPTFASVPDAACLDRLLEHARRGNMRAIRSEMESASNGDPSIRPFAAHLDGLAQTYQTRKILELLEHFGAERPSRELGTSSAVRSVCGEREGGDYPRQSSPGETRE
jgi:signal transduction histidine kinase